MSHIKRYIEKSILIPPDIKTSIGAEAARPALEGNLLSFMETYIPMEQEILSHVNRELEILNSQIKAYLKNKEEELRKQEMGQIDLEIAYL